MILLNEPVINIGKKVTNLAVFIPHKGCPHMCSFCNQHVITGNENEVTADGLKRIIEEQLPFLEKNDCKTEIAFFGGTFTSIERGYMEELLDIACFYKERYPDIICGLRCSTRPDAVDGEVLSLLKEYGMTAIELGAQSMDGDVLKANRRGHSEHDTEKAAKLIKEYGFELGLQMMTGLYLDTPEKSIYTAERFIELKPDTVRIYPTVVMPDTELAKLFKNGIYETFNLETTINLCADLYEMFTKNGIRVIRIGLDTSTEIEKNMLGGSYHPAMGELCISRYFFKKMKNFMFESGEKSFLIETDKKYISKINGHKSENRKKLESLGFSYRIIEKQGKIPEIKNGLTDNVE